MYQLRLVSVTILSASFRPITTIPGEINITVEFLTAGGSQVSTKTVSFTSPPTTSWTDLELEDLCPPGAVKADIYAHIVGSVGTTHHFIDDFSFKEEVPVVQPIEMYALGGQHTGITLATGWQGPIPFSTPLDISKADNINDDFVRNADGTVTVLNAGIYDIAVTASGPNAGGYTQAHLVSKTGGGAPAYIDRFLTGFSQYMTASFYMYEPMVAQVRLAANERIGLFLYHESGGSLIYKCGEFLHYKSGYWTNRTYRSDGTCRYGSS